MFLDAFNKPIIALNDSELNSGEPLQINCSAVELDITASFLYLIRVNDTVVANENKSFVHTIPSVKSTEAGNYICEVSLTAVPDIKRVSNGKILSGKWTFLIVNFSFLSNMEVFLYFLFSSFCMMETLNGLVHLSLVLHLK